MEEDEHINTITRSVSQLIDGFSYDATFITNAYRILTELSYAIYQARD